MFCELIKKKRLNLIKIIISQHFVTLNSIQSIFYARPQHQLIICNTNERNGEIVAIRLIIIKIPILVGGI